MTTERVPTILMLIKQWCPSGLGAESEWLIATLEAREREVLAAALAEAAAGALEQAAQLVPDCGSGYACRTLNEKFSTYCPNCKLKRTIRSLSPIPNAKALWEAEAELRQSKEIYMATQASHNSALITYFEKHIAELESAVAKLREGR